MHQIFTKYAVYAFLLVFLIGSFVTFSKKTVILKVDEKEHFDKTKSNYNLQNKYYVQYATNEGEPTWYNFNISVPSWPQNPCGSLTDDSAIIVIYTSVTNMEGRSIIRNTYANATLLNELNMRHVFVIGKFRDGENEKKWKMVKAEQEIYQDIVIGDFVDTYRNLSYKGLTALRFVQEYCKKVKWVIKLDDDAIADTPRIIYKLRNGHSHRKLTLFGEVFYHAKPIICPHKPLKWCVNKTSIHASKVGRRYPNYVMGIGYVLTADLVPHMLEQAADNPPFDIDDVYMTGILTRFIKGNKIIQWGRIIQNKKLRKLIPGKHIIGHSSIEHITDQWELIQEYNRNHSVTNAVISKINKVFKEQTNLTSV